MEIVLATSNAGKINEFNSLLAPMVGISQASLQITSPPETGQTFIENALIKARYAAQKSNKPTIADDSGLVVPQLNGEPGIFSARFAHVDATAAENNALLLKKLKETGLENPDAYFYAAIVFLRYPTDPMPLIGLGSWKGLILTAPRGIQGFGYDPLFFIPALNKTAAELTMAQKNQYSHRAQALQMIRAGL